MHLQRIHISNFRLLRNVEFCFDDTCTVIVGRNNSGKTSLTEFFRRLLSGGAPVFELEDFSADVIPGVFQAYRQHRAGDPFEDYQDLLPKIEARIVFEYETDRPDLGPVSEFIIDLDPAVTEAFVDFCYEFDSKQLDTLFDGLKEPLEYDLPAFCKSIRDRINATYECRLFAVDPGDSANRKKLEWSALHAALAGGFVNAQRGLDDITQKERDTLGKVMESLFYSAKGSGASAAERAHVQELEDAVFAVENSIDAIVKTKWNALVPALESFGYPGLGNPGLSPQTRLDVKLLLSNHTRIRYDAGSGVDLPETFNGLGTRNLVLILLRLYEFFRAYQAASTRPAVHLVFIEEPEVHLHPQMQEVFIRKLAEIQATFVTTFNAGEPWPVQFIVSTHSSHIANEARFEATRYFVAAPVGGAAGVRSTQVKDLSSGLAALAPFEKDFLHKYMTLTRCDLLFADKAVVIEGPTERILLPRMIEKVDSGAIGMPLLASQYVTVLEVGGAYAHIFFPLLQFLELPALIITDIDAVKLNGTDFVKCPVHEGATTSNACIKKWFPPVTAGTLLPIDTLVSKTDAEKTRASLHLVYQVPEVATGPCGRSFEDAFMLANPALFALDAGTTSPARAQAAWDKAAKLGKSKPEFALGFAIEDTTWTVPRYIAEGLAWLALAGRPEPTAAAVTGTLI